jgi:hypothetical protein
MMRLSIGRLRLRWRVVALALIVAVALGGTAVWTNVLGAGDRFDRMLARIEAIIDPPPDRPTLPTIVVTQQPSPSPTPLPVAAPYEQDDVHQLPRVTPSPTPRPRVAVDVVLVADHDAVFASQITTKMCAVAGTQMALAVMGLADTSEAFQNALGARIGEWESWEDSHNGGWGPAAISLALAAYGAQDYEIRAYDARADALRDSAIALSLTGKPVVLLPWWGAHTWVMTGYRADADPTYFTDATVTGTYILDPWYPRVSSIWGPSDPPGNFEDLAELERNWPAFQGPPGYEQVGPGWTRPEGAYPGRDGKFVILLPPGSGL